MKSVFKFLGVLLLSLSLYSCSNNDDSSGSRSYDLYIVNNADYTISVYINSDNEGSNAGFVLRGNVLRLTEEYVGSYKSGVSYTLRVSVYPEPADNYAYQTTFEFTGTRDQFIEFSE